MTNKLLKTYMKQVKKFPRLSLKQELYLLKNRRTATLTTLVLKSLIFQKRLNSPRLQHTGLKPQYMTL